MTRHGPDGKAYGEHEGSPAIFDLSRFPFGDESYEKLNAALDAFATLPQSKVEGYSDIKRALLQRHLWSVFDATVPVRWIDPRTDDLHVSSRSHSDRRAAVQPRIALLIRRLALTRDQILALPDTMAATVKSGRFAPRHDPEDRFKPFLPSDLYSKESSWICLGEVDRPIPANIHSDKFKWRSAFLSFMRVPGGRSETLKWIEKFNRKEEFPVGTQFAFIEQAFLISNDGELILSPLIVSISLRAYVGVNPHERTGRPAATQCVAEFVMQPRQLMQGNAVMKAMAPRDYRFEAGDAQSIEGGADDPFETGEMPIRPRLDLCMSCHGQSNPGSVRTVGLRTARPLLLKEGSPEAISKATSTQKRDDDTWKTLDGLWQVDSARRGSDPREGSGQPPPPLDNNGKPEDRRPTATVAPRS
jgi:hypothetical protein